MHRTLFLLLATAFLGMQMLSVAHAVEYGSGGHEHEGTDCEICLSTKYQDCISPGATSEACLFHHVEYVPQSPIDVIIVRDTKDAGIIRGPPISS